MSHLILYDGVCGLCSRLVQFVLARDARDKFRFAALQSHVAERELSRYGKDPRDLDTMYVLRNYGTDREQLVSRGRAGVFVLRELGGLWRLAAILAVLPTALLNAGYAFVARTRYRWFGKTEQCLLPSAEQRAKFIDLHEGRAT